MGCKYDILIQTKTHYIVRHVVYRPTATEPPDYLHVGVCLTHPSRQHHRVDIGIVPSRGECLNARQPPRVRLLEVSFLGGRLSSDETPHPGFPILLFGDVGNGVCGCR